MLALLLGSIAPVFADDPQGTCITPTTDVVTSVTVRKSPTTSSAVTGRLLPGDSAPVISDVPNWYRIGTGQSTGYVSKRWTAVASCPSQTVDLPTAPATSTPLTPDFPSPLLAATHPVTWWFAFKFNTASFPGCGSGTTQSACAFGGSVKSYAKSQQFVFASSEHAALQKGSGCIGTSVDDPVGATFSQIYSGAYYYVVWNDQFYDAPKITGCTGSCSAPWGHSKGILAWNEQGSGVVMQVSTPSWPASGGSAHARQSDGNTLGCVIDDDVKVSQHFFALKLNELDVRRVLLAIQNASVVTDPSNIQIVNNGGPRDLTDLVETLGKKSTNGKATVELLSSGVTLISKPSLLHVPPWQLVSAELHGVPLRTATWWASPQIPSTTSSTTIGCWSIDLPAPGAVQIAVSGQWDGIAFGLKGGSGNDFNHAKIGVSTDGSDLTVFGDMNQQGALSTKCTSSQNGRGGLFFVLPDHDLNSSVASLIAGDTAPP